MKIIEVISDARHKKSLTIIAEKNEIKDVWFSIENEDGRMASRFIVPPTTRQQVLDDLQNLLDITEDLHIVIMPIEANIRFETEDEKLEKKEKASIKATKVSREEIFSVVEKGVNLDSVFLLLVFLSSIVAAIGLLENNVAVIIGAMVIAPLLGPNLGFSLGASLGESELIIKSLKSLITGGVFAIAIAYCFGLVWNGSFDSSELLSRTVVAYSTTAIAMASGAAASLSLVSGVSGVLVGVMVAVALMPPAVTIGLMLSIQEYNSALGASLLLVVNIVSITLSAMLVFLFSGIKPRTWLDAHKAKQSHRLYILIWCILLFLLFFITYYRLQNP